MRKTFVNTSPNTANQRVAALEKEVHELRQQLIRKEAEINRRESVEGKRLKLQNDLRQVNEEIQMTVKDIEELHNQVHDYQRKLFLDTDTREVHRSTSLLLTTDEKTDKEQSLEQKIESVQRQRKSALKIALKLLSNDLIRSIQAQREREPAADILDVMYYVLQHPAKAPLTPPNTTPDQTKSSLQSPVKSGPGSPDLRHLLSPLITSPLSTPLTSPTSMSSVEKKKSPMVTTGSNSSSSKKKTKNSSVPS